MRTIQSTPGGQCVGSWGGHVDVACGAEVVAQYRAEQGESAYAVTAGEAVQHGVVDAQSRPEVHVLMMPHQRIAGAKSHAPIDDRHLVDRFDQS